MKRSGFKKLSYEDALIKAEATRAGQRARAVGKARENARKRVTSGLRKRSPKAQANQSRELAFTKAVRERDRCMCRWFYPDGSRCTYQDPNITVHHINERSQRPDEKFNPDNGACICPEHHDYMHHTVAGRERGRVLGLLGGETYEKAMKRKRDGSPVA